ncbi:MAG: hypothetical protein ACI4TB_01910 [Lachnospiraceae bacterium]
MPWCPKCKNEYREGITVCSDCGCELLPDNVSGMQPVTFGSREEMEEIAEFLKYSHIDEVEISFDENEEVYELSVPEKESKQAEKLVLVFKQQKELQKQVEKTEDLYEILEEEKTPVKPSELYENSAQKAEENRSSAYMLLIFGIAGLAVIILGIAGVLPFHLSGTTKYMTYGIMSALFLLFIVMGLVSMKSYRIFAKKAESENSLRSTMEKWCLETLDAKKLDEELFPEEEEGSEEEKYFKRTSLMKEKIKKQFLNLDEAFLDNFVDEIYTDIYEE